MPRPTVERYPGAMRIPGLALAVADEGIEWRPTRYRGVQWLPLHLGSPERAGPGGTLAPGKEHEGRESAVLVRMAPGCGYPAHRHVGVEDVLVLEGGYRDELGDHVAGSYVRYAAGTAHAPVALGSAEHPTGPDNPPCVLFAVAREGTEVLDGGSAPLA